MMRKRTLVPLFAALAVAGWAQPPAETTPANEAPQTIQRQMRPPARGEQNAENAANVKRAAQQRLREAGKNIKAKSDEAAVPGTVPTAGQTSPGGTTNQTVPRVPGEGQPQSRETRMVPQVRSDKGVNPNADLVKTPSSIRLPGEANPVRNPNADLVKTPNTSRVPGQTNPGQDNLQIRTPRPTIQPSPSLEPTAKPSPSPRPTETPVPTPVKTPVNTPEMKPVDTTTPTPEVSTPAPEAATPTPEASTPAPEASPSPEPKSVRTPVKTPAGANATPFVPADMPANLRGNGKDKKRNGAVTPAPTAATTPEAAATATPEAAATATPESAVSPTPAGATATPSTPAKAIPEVANTPQTVDQRLKQAADRNKRQEERRIKKGGEKAIEASQAPAGTLNQAAEALLGNEPGGKTRGPAKIKLTPWIAETPVANATPLPAGATPTPTPAPNRIFVKDRNKFLGKIKDIKIAPTPPPAPTPGVTPVPTPPGVTPVPHNWHPPHNWKPYPGWKPDSGWKPPVGWTPPGGWSPPPGWQAPQGWEVRLRGWGWNYIPRRGWVVPVQWAPPPDFVVPPNWYYLPQDSYSDYGLYDPSEVVVLPGQSRPDLQVNINTTQIYNPPAPPPAVVLDAPPPPPRPAPALPPPMPAEITTVQEVTEVLSRPRQPNAPRYSGPVLVTGSVHFDYDSYAIQPDSFATLDAIGQSLVEELPDAIINVEGHTDSDGSDEYNQTLSEQRAWSVKSYIVQKFGIDPNRLIIVGYGERAPIASNNSDGGKAQNRRVEFENVTDLYKSQVIDTAVPDSTSY